MTDILDAAAELEEFNRVRAVETARRQSPAAVETGRCLWCDESVGAGRRWCNRECAGRWENNNR